MSTETERWTVITEEGLLMVRSDLFTEEEARAHVAAHPLTPNGKSRQFAVPQSLGRRCTEQWQERAEEAERQLRQIRRDDTLLLLEARGLLPSEETEKRNAWNAANIRAGQ
jgi:hypothetical protein